MDYPLNLDNPQTFCEKLQWLKLYDRNPLYHKLVDKYEVKKWVAEKVGEKYIIRTLKIYDSPEQIKLDELPNQFVLKCNHDSGSLVICKDKSKFDLASAREHLSRCLHRNFYQMAREWPYKNIPRKIIAEQFIEDEIGEALTDYKWFCFNGEPKIMYIGRDKGEHPTTDFFDMEFNLLPISIQDPPSAICPDKPIQFDEMRYVAAILSKNIPEVRVDFYVVNNNIYFGEMTFYHLGGFFHFNDKKWDDLLGSWLQLPNKK